MTEDYDVAIIGGGPGGSTAGALLKKYRPDLRVLILEKERFPRDHVGESQLPPISDILDEMGCWDKVEAADFPIKIGVTFRWGKTRDLWDFEFLPVEEFKDEPRPAAFEGQRRRTAFQVDRAVYDDILLRHAESLGCEVREETRVRAIQRDGDRVTRLDLDGDDTPVTARHYIDASGHVGVLRRAMGVETEVPTRLQNIAIFDYWENADWAVEIGVGGTRVQVMSLEYGWIWFIPLGPTRTSVGLICPVEYYKASGKTPEALYAEAIAADERIRELMTNATARGTIETTSDWSFLAERTVGENWLLVGESAGFADPILAAGLTLTHTGAREAAYTILEMERDEHEAAWLLEHYDRNQRDRVRQHIRFADFWYAANGQFTDLKDHCTEIAKESGLRLSPAAAWRWLAQGGFSNDVVGQAGIGGLDLAGVKQVTQRFTDKDVEWQAGRYNVFKLNLHNAREEYRPAYENGAIRKILCYTRGDRHLPVVGTYETLIGVLSKHSSIDLIHEAITAIAANTLSPAHASVAVHHAMQALEVMVGDGWVLGKLDKRKPRLELSTPVEGRNIHAHRP